MTEEEVGCPFQSELRSEWLLDYVTGRLDPDCAADIDHHASRCVSCRQLIESQRILWHALDGLEKSTPSADFDKRLMERIQQDYRPAWTVRLAAAFRDISWKPAVPAAALLALWMLGSPYLGAPPPPTAVAQVEQVERALEDIDMLQQLHHQPAPRQLQ